MSTKIQLLSIFFICFLLTGCGFKKVHQSHDGLIQIQNLKISGNNRLANIIKNKINLISAMNGRNKINLTFKLSKNKSVKEKNISNRITKYEITLVAKMTLKDIKTSREINKNFQKTLMFNTGRNFSVTISNENKIIKELAKQISEEIIYFLNISYKDK